MSEPDRDRDRPTTDDRGTGRSGPTRRRLLETTAVGGATASFAGCLDAYGTVLGSAEGDDPVRIGVLAPQPDGDPVGRSMVQSARVAVDELNDDGGILGRDVELVAADTGSSPLEARRTYQELLLEEDVDVTTGVFASEALLELMDQFAEQETIHFTTGAATSAASRRVSESYDDYKYHFRAGPTNDADLGRAQIDFLDQMGSEVGWESVAVLAEDYAWTERPWEIVREDLEETGLENAFEERYSPATDDFSSLYDEVESAGADAAIIVTAHTGTDAVLDWVQPEPRSFAFGGTHVPLQLPTYYEQTDGACEYAFGQTGATARSSITDRNDAFVAAYREAFDGQLPVYTGYHTYDAVVTYAAAVEETGALESDAVVETLEEIEVTGSIGTISFYGEDHEFAHDLVYQPEETIYFQWRETEDGDGVQEVVYPEEHATQEFVEPLWLRDG